MNSSAVAVVTTWRRGDHVGAWAEPAASMTPSEVTRMAAGTWGEIRGVIDAQADMLANYGFLPGLPLMRELRGLATQAAQSAQRAHAWANDLRDAELADA